VVCHRAGVGFATSVIHRSAQRFHELMAKGNRVKQVLIMGAAGRDFHNFNVYFRDRPGYRVVAFTATQIPTIESRCYPPELAGTCYPKGIAIYPEDQLVRLIREHQVDIVVFSYSDVPYHHVMHTAAVVQAEGAAFWLLGPRQTMLPSRRCVVSVCAVRTGCGKSATTRQVCTILRQHHKKVVAVRHPMPYGALGSQMVQRFATYEDLAHHQCTIEEREEYEPLVEAGIVVYAGVDYGRILHAAEEEADVIVWDGGNNDLPFFQPDVHLVLFDPHRAGHETQYYPGEANMRMADIAIINKVDTATPEQVEQVRHAIAQHAPRAAVVLAESPVWVQQPECLSGKRVVVVEDGPTLTHGGMPHGAGWIAATAYGVAAVVDPRPFAVGSIQEVYRQYPHIGPVLPAMGYGSAQMRDLEQTINRSACDLVLFATPMQLPQLLTLDKPTLRVRYDYRDHGRPTLADVLVERLGASLVG
jgi:predicted GTPase